MVGWQRRALGALCGRVDLLQQDIDRQAGAQTELESRLLDLEQYVLMLAPRTWKQWQWCCVACSYSWRSATSAGPLVYCPRCGAAQRAADDDSVMVAEALWCAEKGLGEHEVRPY